MAGTTEADQLLNDHKQLYIMLSQGIHLNDKKIATPLQSMIALCIDMVEDRLNALDESVLV